MKRLAALAILAALVGTTLTGCIIAPDDPYHHHHDHDHDHDRGYYYR